MFCSKQACPCGAIIYCCMVDHININMVLPCSAHVLRKEFRDLLGGAAGLGLAIKKTFIVIHICVLYIYITYIYIIVYMLSCWLQRVNLKFSQRLSVDASKLFLHHLVWNSGFQTTLCLDAVKNGVENLAGLPNGLCYLH